jgi:tetraacyldisaccharide 4'-kinase
MKLLKIIGYPFSIIYAVITSFRNLLYDLGIYKTHEFDIKLISVGNLTTGGTGKSPHIEYLIRLLKEEGEIATLSRGYKRKTTGFVLADENSTAEQIGDEPLQFKKKFNEVQVAVDVNRARGIEKLTNQFPNLKAIFLDDAFQHRSIKPGINIMLTDYANLYYNDYLLPAGSLRETRSGFKRADIIIVTKIPPNISAVDRRRVLKEIDALEYQTAYFTYIKYGDLIPLRKELNPAVQDLKKFSVLMLTGIANPISLNDHLKEKVKSLQSLNFSDHHNYTIADFQKINKLFEEMPGPDKIIITTEKDAMRLLKAELSDEVSHLPIYYLPIEIEFHGSDGKFFNDQVLTYFRANKINVGTHKKYH